MRLEQTSKQVASDISVNDLSVGDFAFVMGPDTSGWVNNMILVTEDDQLVCLTGDGTGRTISTTRVSRDNWRFVKVPDGTEFTVRLHYETR